MEHARLRSGATVSAVDVKAAVQEFLAEIEILFQRAAAGQIEEIELTDAQFGRLGTLSFRRPDVGESADDDL